MDKKHAIVINAKGYKVKFVLVNIEETPEGIKETPLYYTLKDGESLVYEDISTALSLCKPRWTGTKWEETAMPEEIAAVEAARLEALP